MFERYTESARRVLFFARYEASRLGTTSIETEHILLGLIREPKGVVPQILRLANVSPADIHRDVQSQAAPGPNIPTNVESPFTADTKRALCFAAEEADRLLHTLIEPEHVLLGLLREERSAAASMLTKRGVRLNDIREAIVKLHIKEPTASVPSTGGEDVSDHIEQIKLLVGHLAKMSPGSSEAVQLDERICLELDELKRAFGG